MNVEEDLRTVQELSLVLSAELGVRPTLIPQAVRALRDRITWTNSANTETRRIGPRLYGPEAVAAIREWVEEWKKARAGRNKAVDRGARFWLKIARLEEAAARLGRRVIAANEIRQEIDELCRGLREQPMTTATGRGAVDRARVRSPGAGRAERGAAGVA